MKNFTKKICVILCAAMLTAVAVFSGCSILSSTGNSSYNSGVAGNGTSGSQTNNTIYVATEDVTTEKLMQTRSLIRSSNIYIETTYIYTYTSMGMFGRPTTNSQTLAEALGSGIIFDADDDNYYALTNNHVITNIFTDSTGRQYNCTVTYKVTDINGNTYTGQLVMADGDDNDIAIISFPKKSGAEELHQIDYTARLDDNVIQGEFVLAVGNPGGVKHVVTYGEVLGSTTIENVSYSVIHHNALINSGNSGGALCDIDGNLIGINTWGSSGSDEDNYAIPLSVVNELIDEFNATRETAQEAA